LPVHSFDRSVAIEDAMVHACARALNRPTDAANPLTEPFLALRPGGASAVPALYLTSASVERGARVVISPWSWRTAGVAANDTRRDLVDLHDQIGGDVTLVQAAHNSARFTFVSPAGRLLSPDGQDRGYVVDGGYFENTGIETALD